MPTGCAFAARCTLAVDACRAAPPGLEPAGPAHEVRCLRWREAVA
jgi:ABC-type dipeptide/oligopeptide/nickel transport system ATPase component